MMTLLAQAPSLTWRALWQSVLVTCDMPAVPIQELEEVVQLSHLRHRDGHLAAIQSS